MSRRLVDRFAVAAEVEIQFQRHDDWFSGQVVAHQHPGVWVQLVQGGQYFVTNSSRIRLKTTAHPFS